MRKLKKFLLGAAALFLGVTGTAAASFPAYADGAMGAASADAEGFRLCGGEAVDGARLAAFRSPPPPLRVSC